ncbi:MAG: tetratricopeptide repeat protein [Myxococcales bacterium]|nr:tetratricopeptide repeat protein [Myxococcales bacterium]
MAALLEELPAAPARGFRLDELSAGFRALQGAAEGARRAAEATIWEVWCDHPDREAKQQMARGMQLLGAGELPRAEALFDELIEREPSWAEAWNKRATIYFLQGRDAASVGDIRRTLTLEPRHFGALGGFAQICMRNGSPDAALAALERLLLVNPAAPGILEVAEALRRQESRTFH